jgi:predicted enzyme related to lactoylglutathione lyase
MFQGLRTVIYNPGDMEKGKAWYKQVLGIDPYFDDEGYVGFNVGGFELGLTLGAAKPAQDTGVTAYWGVADIDAVYKRLLELGAKPASPIEAVGGDIRLATVIDPFGNMVGIIQNPHFKVE